MATQLIARISGGDLTKPADFVRKIGAQARAAVNSTGTTGGGNFLKINRDTGALTFGQNNTPLPKDRRRYITPLGSFRHGYIVCKGGKFVERHLVPRLAQPDKPMPKEAFVGYREDGPQESDEITLASVDEPGFTLILNSMAISHTNRINSLFELATNWIESEGEAALAGFIHPVILLKTGSYPSSKKGGLVHHFDYELLDWLHLDGETLLSKSDGKAPATAAVTSAADDGDEDDELDLGDDDDLTADERELLKA